MRDGHESTVLRQTPEELRQWRSGALAGGLYSVMFLAALSVELYGTWLGNWVRHPTEPCFGLTSANPPLAAGSFYCMLDVLVGLTVRGIVRRMRSVQLLGVRPAG